MKKTLLFAAAFFAAAILVSCQKNQSQIIQIDNAPDKIKLHKWYAFTDTGFEQVESLQKLPYLQDKPWTEAVRISSAASFPSMDKNGFGYALVNRRGLLVLTPQKAELYQDRAIFSLDTADSLVFSGGTPVFYLYRSTFFNENINGVNAIQKSRPFLVEFNPSGKIFFPLVSYENLKLSPEWQITGFFWNGKTWVCSAKNMDSSKVDFSYFSWEPLLPLTDMSPAFGNEYFVFNESSESEFKKINMPRLYKDAPRELRELLDNLPKDFTFYVSYRDKSGTSPISYFNQGKNDDGSTLYAKAFCYPSTDTLCAVFADGTTYIKKTGSKTKVIRLPLLPAGFSYGECALAGNTLYVAWEESNFYKTFRTGFVSVDLSPFNL